MPHNMAVDTDTELASFKALGLEALIQFRVASQRPAILFSREATNTLAAEARKGMSYAHFHEVLVARGFEL